MAGDSKKQIKWRTLIVGLVLIGYNFYPQGRDLMPDDLSSKTIILNSDIVTIHSVHNASSYRQLWTKETDAAFTIATPGDLVAPDRSLDSLKKGDTLTVKYSSLHDNELKSGYKEIPIYYLQKGKRVYFELSSYNKAREVYTARSKVLALVIGIVLLLYGFNVISQKFAWIAGVAGVVVLFILRALNLL